MPNVAMIFAAGHGTRMGDLTKDRPKPLIEVGDRPLIEHALALVSGIENIVVNTHYLASQMEAYLADTVAKISYEPTLLETGGGLKNALPMIDSDAVITLNSDAVWTGANPVKEMLSLWDPSRMDALLALVDPNNAVAHKGRGDFLVSDAGLLRRGPGKIYTGCQIIKTDRIREIEDEVFSLNLVWDRILADQRAFGVTHSGGWCDVGHPEGIRQAEAMLEAACV